MDAYSLLKSEAEFWTIPHDLLCNIPFRNYKLLTYSVYFPLLAAVCNVRTNCSGRCIPFSKSVLVFDNADPFEMEPQSYTQ